MVTKGFLGLLCARYRAATVGLQHAFVPWIRLAFVRDRRCRLRHRLYLNCPSSGGDLGGDGGIDGRPEPDQRLLRALLVLPCRVPYRCSGRRSRGENGDTATATAPLTAPMSQSSTASSTQGPQRRRRASAGPRSWRQLLILGVCLGLGYGLTLRLLDLPMATGWKGVQRFGVKTFPGTELDSLRKQFGDRGEQIRGDLDLLELERQQQRDAAEVKKRQAEMTAREQHEQQQQQNLEDRQRLEAVQQEPQDPQTSLPAEPAPEPAPAASPSLSTPALPPPPAPAAAPTPTPAPGPNPPTTP